MSEHKASAYTVESLMELLIKIHGARGMPLSTFPKGCLGVGGHILDVLCEKVQVNLRSGTALVELQDTLNVCEMR